MEKAIKELIGMSQYKSFLYTDLNVPWVATDLVKPKEILFIDGLVIYSNHKENGKISTIHAHSMFDSLIVQVITSKLGANRELYKIREDYNLNLLEKRFYSQAVDNLVEQMGKLILNGRKIVIDRTIADKINYFKENIKIKPDNLVEETEATGHARLEVKYFKFDFNMYEETKLEKIDRIMRAKSATDIINKMMKIEKEQSESKEKEMLSYQNLLEIIEELYLDGEINIADDYYVISDKNTLLKEEIRNNIVNYSEKFKYGELSSRDTRKIQKRLIEKYQEQEREIEETTREQKEKQSIAMSKKEEKQEEINEETGKNNEKRTEQSKSEERQETNDTSSGENEESNDGTEQNNDRLNENGENEEQLGDEYNSQEPNLSNQEPNLSNQEPNLQGENQSSQSQSSLNRNIDTTNENEITKEMMDRYNIEQGEFDAEDNLTFDELTSLSRERRKFEKDVKKDNEDVEKILSELDNKMEQSVEDTINEISEQIDRDDVLGIDILAEPEDNPQVDWVAELKNWFTRYEEPNLYSYMRPNKKLMWTGIATPSKSGYGDYDRPDTIHVYIDVSSSMDSASLRSALAEVDGILDEYREETKLYSFATELKEIDPEDYGKTLDRTKLNLSGMTNISDVFMDIESNDNSELINIIITDGQFGWSSVKKYVGESRLAILLINVDIDELSVDEEELSEDILIIETKFDKK